MCIEHENTKLLNPKEMPSEYTKKIFHERASVSSSQLQKVFLPPGTDFLRRNFPNIEEEFS